MKEEVESPIITLEKKAQIMAKGVKSVAEGGNIKILCGEGNHNVYNEEELIKAFEYAKDEKGATIQVIIGPVISTDNEGRNGLLESEKKGKIKKIYYRPQRGALFHFGVFEKEGTEKGSYSFLDIELPHGCNVSDDKRRRPDFLLFLSEERKEEALFWADKFSIDFDHWIEELHGKPLKEGAPIKFTDEQLTRFLAAIERDGKDFNFLETEELLIYKEKMLKE